jgi:hypothetical protein
LNRLSTRARLCLVLLLSPLACRGDRGAAAIPLAGKVLLRYHPRAGAVFQYQLEQTSRLAPDTPAADSGPRNTLALRFTQRVDSSGDRVRLTTTLDSAQLSTPLLSPASAAQAEARVPATRLSAVFDDRQRLLGHDWSALDRLPPTIGDQIQLGFRAMAVPFPEQPVGMGDSWTNEVELPFGEYAGGAVIKATTRLTVRALSVAAGDTTVRLGVETELPDRPLYFSIGGQAITVRLAGALTGEQVLSLTRGALVEASLVGTMKVNVKGGFLGPQGMAMRVDQQGTMRLVKP